MVDKSAAEQVASGVDRQRLIETATALIEVPSPTRDAGAVADRLAEILKADGFDVERPAGGGPNSWWVSSMVRQILRVVNSKGVLLSAVGAIRERC